MTIAETILQAVKILVNEQGLEIFTRADVRQQADIDRDTWNRSYTPVFQGMRSAPAGKGPSVREEFKNVFQQIEHGKYQLTNYGATLINDMGE